jgi:hypothetical protein
MRSRACLLVALGLSLGAAAITQRAHAEGEAPAPPRYRSVPINVGLVPFADINGHIDEPANHLTVDGVAGWTAHVAGFALGGTTSGIRDDLDGLQISGIVSYVGGATAGASVGGVVAYAGGPVAGLQLASVASVSRAPVRGVQLGGVTAVARAVDGVQLGLVNIAGPVRGAQIGLVNVAESVDGASVGLVNVVRRDGTRAIEFSTTNLALTAVAAKLGARHVYSLIGGGMQPLRPRTVYTPFVGAGARIGTGDARFVQIDGTYAFVADEDQWATNTGIASLRIALGQPVDARVSIVFGPAVDVHWSTEGRRLADIGYLPPLATFGRDSSRVDVGVGFLVGVRIH